jgi:hypothetical protein
MGKNRNYSCKDVDMLMAAKTVAENFKANIAELATVRTDWTEAYATSLSTRVDSAVETYLGIDSKKELRNATTQLAAIMHPAMRNLSFFKTQIDDDFKSDSSVGTEILRILGFAKHLRSVQKGNQESLSQLLYAFKLNMTTELRTTITAKGLSPTLIDTIIGYADVFSQANVSQESLKATTREITQEALDAFNSIYDEVIGICKKASSYYQYEPLKKEQFTFGKVLTRMGSTRKVVEGTPSTTP